MFLISLKNSLPVTIHKGTKWIGFQSLVGFLYLLSNANIKVISTQYAHYFLCNESFINLKDMLKKKIQKQLLNAAFGFSVKIKLIGVGYKMEIDNENQILQLKFGYSHNINVPIQKGLKIKRFNDKSSIYIFTFIDEKILKNFITKIKKFRPVEPYKGKGFRFLSEILYRKEGKKSNL